MPSSITKKSRYFLELLAVLGSSALEGMITIPQYQKMFSSSFDENFSRRLEHLREKGLIAVDSTSEKASWVASLTTKGKSLVKSSIDLESEWDRPWDKKWRLIAFDLPRNRTRERQALRKWMKDMRLGKLQGSLWITPRSLGGWSSDFENRRIDPSSVVFFEGRFSGVKSNEDHVSKAWDFSVINSRYSDYLDFVSRMTKKRISRPRFPSWFNEEIELWTHALEVDPILPRELWPRESGSNYLGPEALSARRRFYRHWGRHLEPAQVSPV